MPLIVNAGARQVSGIQTVIEPRTRFEAGMEPPWVFFVDPPARMYHAGQAMSREAYRSRLST